MEIFSYYYSRFLFSSSLGENQLEHCETEQGGRTGFVRYGSQPLSVGSQSTERKSKAFPNISYFV